MIYPKQQALNLLLVFFPLTRRIHILGMFMIPTNFIKLSEMVIV